MENLKTVTEKLGKAFDFNDVEWRVGATFENNGKMQGIALPYVTNRAIQDRLDEVFGIDGWYNEFKKWGDNAQLCGISCRFGDKWITKWDGCDNSVIESCKGGLSNSQKRCAVQFNIGRYIYKIETVFVDVEVKGNSKKIIKKEYAKLENFYNKEVSRLQGTTPPPNRPYNNNPNNGNTQPNNNSVETQVSNKDFPAGNQNVEDQGNNNNVLLKSLIKCVKNTIKLKEITVVSVCSYYKVTSIDNFTIEQAKDCLEQLKKQKTA